MLTHVAREAEPGGFAVEIKGDGSSQTASKGEQGARRRINGLALGPLSMMSKPKDIPGPSAHRNQKLLTG